MKTTVRSIVTRAIALAFTFIAGTSLADTDELGLTPKHWYKFNNNFNSSGVTAVSISGENAANFFDGVNVGEKAMKIVDGSTHPWGSGVAYGNGAWTVVTVGKAVLSGSNATSFWTTGTKSGWFGLLAKDGSTAVVAKGNGSGISETALTASGIDTTIYHCYAIVYDGNGGLSLYVDGALVDSKTDFSPNTNGSFQWGAVNGGLPTGINRVTDTGLDDWRLYQQALTATEVKTINKAFFPEPNAMWNRDLKDGSTHGDYTLWLDGNSEFDGVATITANNGLRFFNNMNSNNRRVTVIVKYENLAATDANQTLITVGGGNNTSAVSSNSDMIGLYARANNLNANAVWDSGTWNQDTDRTKSAFGNAGQAAFSYDYDGNRTKGYMNGTLAYEATGLRGDKIFIHYVGVGGKYNRGSIGSAKNLRVSGVAIFDKELSVAQVAAFKFPARENAPRVLAINFNDNNNGNEGAGVVSAVLGVDMYGRAWKNVSEKTQTEKQDLPVYDTATQSFNGENAKVTWSSATFWGGTASPVAPFLNRYLDDGSGGAKVNITDIPFEYYDVIVYSHGDQNVAAPNRAVTVNATQYTCGADGLAVPGSAAWGSNGTTIPLWGKTAMIVRDQTGDFSLVGGSSGTGRGPINAIVLVERKEPLKAKRVINLNFNSGSGKFDAGDATPDAMLAGNTPKSSWVNLSGQAGSQSVTSAWDANKGVTATIEGFTVGWNAATTYSASQDISILKGYLDDGNDDTWKDGVQITLTGVPFEAYDVIVYYNTDVADRVYPPVTVNDVAYTWDAAANKTVVGNANWGATYRNGVAYGQNALRISQLAGDATIHSARRLDSENRRGCIPAIQIIEVDPPKQASATISSDVSWSNAPWKDDTLPNADAKVALAFSGSNKLTLDGSALGASISVSGNGQPDQVITIKGTPDKVMEFISIATFDNTFVGSLEYQFDATEASFTASATLMALIKNAGDNMKFVFLGAGSNGATVALADNFNTTINTHLVFNGGVHTFKVGHSSNGTDFGGNATVENPTVLVTGGAKLNFHGHDLCGWTGTFNANGIIKVDDGATLACHAYTGTFFYRQQFYLMPGATMTSDTTVALHGGYSHNNIYIPDSEAGNEKVVRISGIFQIRQSDDGIGIYVGANSKLVLEKLIQDGSHTIAKRGAGTLEVTGNIPMDGFNFEDGVLALANGASIANLTLSKATTIDVASGTATINALSGAITKTGAGTLNLPADYADAITLEAGLVVGPAEAPLTIAGAIDLAGVSSFPIAGIVAATGNSGSIKLPVTFVDGPVIKFAGSELEGSGLTIFDAENNDITSKMTIEDGVIKLVVNEVSATIDQDVEWSSIVWDDDKTWVDGMKATLTLTANAKITFTAPVTAAIVLKGETDVEFAGASYLDTTAIDTTEFEGGIKIDTDKHIIINAAGLVDYTYLGTETTALPIASWTGYIITTSVDMPFDAGALPLTYNYNGTDEITPNLVCSGAFTKGGSGTIILQNSFNPASITVAAGAIKRPAGTTWTFSEKTLTVNAGGKLIMNGGYDKAIDYVIAGDGPAIVQDKAGGSNGNVNGRKLTLAEDAAFETDADFYFVHSHYNANTIELGNYTLTKTGTAGFYLCNTTINGTGTIKVTAGTFSFANNYTCRFKDGTLELDGGNLNVSQGFTLGTLLVKNGAVTGGANLALTNLKIAGVADLTARSLPLSGTLTADSTGALKIVKPARPMKLVAYAGETVPVGLTFTDETGAAIDEVCVYDGFIWYGKAGTGTYTLTEDDLEAVGSLTSGGIYSQLMMEVNVNDIAGVPDDCTAWIDNAMLYIAKHSPERSISIKMNPRSDTEGKIATTDTNVGAYKVAGKFWNHSKNYNNNNAGTTEIFPLIDGTGAAAQDADGNPTLCYYYMPNSYFAANDKQTTGNGKLTHTYFDDTRRLYGDNVTWPYSVGTYNETEYFLPETPKLHDYDKGELCWEVAITNIPYQVFDLYIYHASDQTGTITLLPIAVKANNKSWMYFKGDTAGSQSCAINSTWSGAPYVDSETMQEGVNYIRYRMSKAALGLANDEKLECVYLSHPSRRDVTPGRLGLAGVQIVEVENDGFYTRTAAEGGWLATDSWKNSNNAPITWTNPTGSDVAYATIDADATPSIDLDGAIVATAVTIVNAPSDEGEKTFTFTNTSGEGSLTTPTIDASGFNGKIVVCAGMTGSINLGENAYIEVDIPANTEKSLDELLPGISITGGSVKLTGAGTLVCDGELPETYKTSLQNSAWQGTVWIKNMFIPLNGKHINAFGDYKNANSAIRLTGVRGWLNNGNQNVDLELTDDGDTLGLEIQDSSDGYKYLFPKFTGTGSFKAATRAGSNAAYFVTDVSEFKGALLSTAGTFYNPGTGEAGNATTARPIYVGYDTNEKNTSTKSLISVKAGVTINAGCGWEAAEVEFGDTLVVNGAEGDVLVNGVTTVPTFNTVVTLKDAQGETVEGEYALGYDSEAQSVTIVRVVTVTIPEIANTTVAVTGGTLVGTTATVPYGAALTVTYTLEADYIFSDGTTAAKAFEFENVTEAPEIDVSGIKAIAISPVTPTTGDVKIYADETGKELVLAATGDGYTGDDVRLSRSIANYTEVKSVVIGAGVKHIGNRYFKDFTGLTTVKGGKDLVKFDEKAFYRCMSLEKIELENPAALESLKDAVVYQMAINENGEFFMIPSIQVSGYVEKLYGKQSLDTKVDDWTEIGLLSGQNLEELKAGGVYHFFQTRLEKDN